MIGRVHPHLLLSRHRSINLSAPLLLEGYRRGLFPMALEDGEIGWFSPDPRGIIPLEPDQFHVPHGLRRRLKHNPFKVQFERRFRGRDPRLRPAAGDVDQRGDHP